MNIYTYKCMSTHSTNLDRLFIFSKCYNITLFAAHSILCIKKHFCIYTFKIFKHQIERAFNNLDR